MTNRKWIFCQVKSKNERQTEIKDQQTYKVTIVSFPDDVPHKKSNNVLRLFIAAYVKRNFLPSSAFLFLFIEISKMNIVLLL